jgi:hypothetical protein
MFRILVAASAMLAVAPATAVADTQYGGSAQRGGRGMVPSISLVLRDSGRIAGRLAVVYSCRGHRSSNLTVRVRGAASGASFTATGRTTMRGVGRLRYRLTGTLSSDAATGTVRLRVRNCRGYTRAFALRTPSAPAGGQALPPRATLWHGLTGQSAAGVRLPVTLRVARNGRVYGSWVVTMRCGRARVSWFNFTPSTAVRADGSFSRTERFTIRYTDGSRERYRVNFRGRFLTDGVTGTLRARMQTYQRGKRFYACFSGLQTWAARP